MPVLLVRPNISLNRCASLFIMPKRCSRCAPRLHHVTKILFLKVRPCCDWASTDDERAARTAIATELPQTPAEAVMWDVDPPKVLLPPLELHGR